MLPDGPDGPAHGHSDDGSTDDGSTLVAEGPAPPAAADPLEVAGAPEARAPTGPWVDDGPAGSAEVYVPV